MGKRAVGQGGCGGVGKREVEEESGPGQVGSDGRNIRIDLDRLVVPAIRDRILEQVSRKNRDHPVSWSDHACRRQFPRAGHWVAGRASRRRVARAGGLGEQRC